MIQDNKLLIQYKLGAGAITPEEANDQLADLYIDNQELILNAKDFLEAIKSWEGNEFKDGMAGHKVVNMRPILLAKQVCQDILNKYNINL